LASPAESKPGRDPNALIYPTSAKTPSGRKSEFPTLPNKISPALAAAGSDFHDDARWER